MIQAHKKSFLILISLLFLFPIFFIPGGVLDLGVAKVALVSFGIVLALLVFLWEIWRAGKLVLPWHFLILAVVLIPVAYLLSALLSTPSAVSLFGYNLEIGTFGYILLASVFLVLISIVFSESSRILQGIGALFISFAIVALFAVIKIVSGGFPVWGVFSGISSNPVGLWTDLAMAFGLLATLSILVLAMIPMNKFLRLLVLLIFGISVILMSVLNFSTVFIFTLVTSVILLIYFYTVERKFKILPIILGAVSILFLINPTISSTQGTLGDVIGKVSGVNNTEVRPSFSATLNVSKATLLSHGAFLGSGPNTFSSNWLIYRPVDVNTTPFWKIAFPSGVGFIPTQISSTGVLGMGLWLVFFSLLLVLGFKTLSRLPEDKSLCFAFISTFLAALYLWTASFIYTPSSVMLMTAFVFSGLFVATARSVGSSHMDSPEVDLPAKVGGDGVIASRTIVFSRNVTTRFVSLLLIVVFAFGSVTMGFVVAKRTLASFYFTKAVELSNTPGAELDLIAAEVDRAAKISAADFHFVALSKIYFAKARIAANASSSAPEADKEIFENSISKSLEAARKAVSENPANYQNWFSLGMVYNSLVPKPLAVPGAYENAKSSYLEAGKRNPFSPEIPLFMAQLEIDNGNIAGARTLVREALVLKEDYADAYVLLAKIEIQEKNIVGAIASAERVALLIPGNANIYFELGLLKYSNADYLGAADAFNLALKVTPNYANAQYYLGLSLAQLKKWDESLKQFEELIKTNPDNEEVKFIHGELKAGRDPFIEREVI